jgi:prepilin-type N-terminal cleavage/methylation domain-containing protein
MNKKGFTLIELLIVIVILGILAVAILSAINPVEQIRKANDSARKSDAAELLSALERYLTTFSVYPWGDTPPVAQATPGVQTWMTELIAKNEVKAGFQNRKTLADVTAQALYVSVDADNLVHVCFLPESATFKALADSTNQGTAGTTHICVPETVSGTSVPSSPT